MLKSIKMAFLAVSSIAAVACAAPDFSMVGFATMDGGTTGGAGGQVVRPTTVDELKKYAEDPLTPYVILIEGEINTGIAVTVDDAGAIPGSISSTYGAVIQLGSNKSVIGVGDKAFFNRVGILIQKKSNIIIRNIKFSMVGVPISKTDENKIVGRINGVDTVLSDPDCIGIQADSAVTAYADKALMYSKNIWIDHCEFYNENPYTSTATKDRYDGLLDAKNNTYDVTVSWCYFHDHHKGSLIGNSDDDEFDHKFTFHHNYFKSIDSRQPLIRFGIAHLFNNYFQGEGSGNATDVRISSDLYIEANHYAYLSQSVFTGSGDGVATFKNNKWEGCPATVTGLCEKNKMRIPSAAGVGSDTAYVSVDDAMSAGSFTPSYSYSSVLDAVADVKTVVTTYAGVGKITVDEYTGVSSSRKSNSLNRSLYSVSGRKLTVTSAVGTPVCVSNLLGMTVFNGKTTSAYYEIALPENNAVYLIKIGNKTSRISDSTRL